LPLLHVGLWCVGEYGDILVSKIGLEKANVDTKPPFLPVSENKVLDTIEKVMKSVVASLTTREYALNALAKLTTRFSEETQERLTKLIGTYKTSIHLELQQRSCEYTALSGGKHKAIRANVVGRMPIPKNIKKKPISDEKTPSETSGSTPVTSVGSPKASPKKVERKLDSEKAKKTNGVKETDEEEDDDETPEEHVEKPKPSKKQPRSAPAEKEKEPPKPTAEPNIFDLDIFNPGSPQPQSPPKGSGSGSGATNNDPLNLLDDIFIGTGLPQSHYVIPQQQKQQSPPIQQQASPDFSILDFSSPPTSTPSPFIPQPTFSSPVPSFTPPPVSTPGADALLPVVVFQESSLTVAFQSERKTGNPGYLRVIATFTNSSNAEFTDFDFQVAVPQFVTLQMEPASGRVLTSHTPITQALVLIHKEPDNPKKKLKIRVKMAYSVQGTPAEHTAQIQKFWA
jgi:AP-1 complex subunit gamma-1